MSASLPGWRALVVGAVLPMWLLQASCGCTGGASRPTLADYKATHSPRSKLTLGGDGRIDTEPGEASVVLLQAHVTGRPFAYDTDTWWTVALQLPARIEPGQVLDAASLEGVARVAGEGILFLSQHARGTVQVQGDEGGLQGTLDLVFEEASQDLLGLKRLELKGPLSAGQQR